MARPSGEKTRCGNQWTEARYRSFIQSLLRQGTRRWAPISKVKQKARVKRGMYLCAGCGEHVPNTLKEGRKRVQNIFVDHINPIFDPEIGFEGWDKYIERMFCEEDNLQLLCKACHDVKSKQEHSVAVERRRKEREANNG
jgi:5-methylcytosine-specific restriction endonuclease McrA